MKERGITRFRLNPKKPQKTDWRAFDAMSEKERHRAALSDPDCPPATEAQLARANIVHSEFADTESSMNTHGEPYPNARRAVQKGADVINIYDGPDAFLKTFAQVRREVGLLYATAFCQFEVCNGGFSQFFGNSTGVLAPEAVEGFIAIGQPQIADIVRRAMAKLGRPY